MKLIIDIPDFVYDDVRALKGRNLVKVNADAMHDAIYNGTPFDSVIEDIKKEIEKELCHSIRDEYSQRQNDYCDGVEFAGKRSLEIIDKHIRGKADE